MIFLWQLRLPQGRKPCREQKNCGFIRSAVHAAGAGIKPDNKRKKSEREGEINLSLFVRKNAEAIIDRRTGAANPFSSIDTPSSQ